MAGFWSWRDNSVAPGKGGWCCNECRCPNDNIITKPHDGINPMWCVGANYCPQCGNKIDYAIGWEKEK